MKRKYKSLLKTSIVLSLLLLSSFMNSKAQETIKHPVSEITDKAKHYSYTYIIDDDTKKEIEYFIVIAPNGKIKTAFNACDVCYRSYKGYSHVGDQMRCNNCGNKYHLNDIGDQGQGGCWPGYLPHEIVNDQVVIKIDELIKGEYYFKEQINTSVIEDLPKDYIITKNNKIISIEMNESKEREIQILDIQGSEVLNAKIDNYVFEYNFSNYSSGVYILLIHELNKTYRVIINV